MNVKDAPYLMVHDYAGGSESLGPRVGIGSAVLRNKVNTNCPTHHLTWNELVKITDITNDHRAFLAWAEHLGYTVVKKAGAEGSVEQLKDAALQAAGKSGMTTAKVDAALNDHQTPGEIDPTEARDILRNSADSRRAHVAQEILTKLEAQKFFIRRGLPVPEEFKVTDIEAQIKGHQV